MPDIDDETVLRVHDLQPSDPVAFETFTGIYQAPLRPVRAAVLMLSPVGYEELCSRAFWSSLADDLALAGAASLRFDYPGTGHALDSEATGLADWAAAARQAADALRRRSGIAEIVVLGQGLGGTLALHWAHDLGPLSGLTLLEPAASGRNYLRGLTAWGKSIAVSSGLDAEQQGPHGVAGFAVSEHRTTAIQELDLKRVPPTGVPDILLLEQQGGPVRGLLSSEPWTRAARLTHHGFAEYAAIVTDPTSALLPREALATIVAWVSGLQGTVAIAPSREADAELEAVLRGDDFEELPIRFGIGRRLAGVLCRPRAAILRKEAVILAGTGRDHSIGWARSAVTQARALARSGVASLRFDASGIGDSRAGPDAPDEILYSEQLCDDLRAAVDEIERRGYTRIGLMGRCSGAWAAFTLATEDPRIGSLAIVNLPYFLWDESKSLAEILRFSQRRVGDLGATLMSRKGLTRLLKGELHLGGAFRFLLRQINLRILRPYAPYLGPLTKESRRFHRLHALFKALQSRDVPVFLAYAAGDASLGELRSFMGQDLARLKRYRNVHFSEMSGADHNFTPEPARSRLQDALVAFFVEHERRDIPRRASESGTKRQPFIDESGCVFADQI